MKLNSQIVIAALPLLTACLNTRAEESRYEAKSLGSTHLASLKQTANQFDHDHSAPHLRQMPDDLLETEAATVRLFQKTVAAVVLIRTAGSQIATNGPAVQALGSGVLIAPNCHVLTAAHVVDGAAEIFVHTADGRDRKAELLFSEPGADIALLRLQNPDPALAHAELGDSDRLAIGQDLFVIGNPRGYENTFTRGILSGFREFNRLYDGTILVEFLQTDAAINSGNSGGPIFDSHGRIVGIASRISTSSGGSEGLGFAVTINSAKQLLALEDRQWTGMQGIFLSSPELKKLFNLDLPGAILVQQVERNSPADKAGLQGGTIPSEIAGTRLLLGGDLILQYGEQQACHSECLVKAHSQIAKSKNVKVIFLREGKRHETMLDLGESRKNFLQ